MTVPLVPYVADPDLTLYVGDALSVLQGLPSESVHCALTSPPFWGLRDYGVEGQIGLEPTPEEWVARLVEVFRELRRVLRRDGTLWIECGDSYAGSWGAQSRENGSGGDSLSAGQIKAHPKRTRTGSIPEGSAYKPKDLLLQPFMLAMALRADGWWLRQCIVWHKPNCMPESATDRCTTAHSYVFLLSKSARYYFDADAIAEPAAWERWGDQTVPKYEGTETAAGWIKPKGKNELIAEHAPGSASRRQVGFNERFASTGRKGNGKRERTEEMRGFDNRLERADGKKNPRSVWSIPTRGYEGAHFATWPEALAERIIKAGTSERGCCPECGAPWVRETETEYLSDPTYKDSTAAQTLTEGRTRNVTRMGDGKRVSTTGWAPSCPHTIEREWGYGPPGPVPCVVLDPFAGAGTTGLVARKLGRRSILIELSETYAAMAAERLSQLSLLAEPTG